MSRPLPVLALAVSLAALLATEAAAATAAPRYTIRWVLVHDHGDAVKQAARAFAERVERETKGGIRVEILSRVEYGKRYKNGAAVGELALIQDLADGKIEAAQTYTNALARYVPRLFVLGLPYLLRDYAHAERVLDGPIGRELLNGFHGLPVHPLAFTYSGGFGFFAADRELRDPGLLRGMMLQMMRGRISLGIANLLSFEFLAGPPEAYAPLAEHGLAQGLESTYSCFVGYGDERYAKVITNTSHFLLTTMVVMNASFFDRLPSDYRKIVEQAAIDAARQERRDSIALNDTLRHQLEGRGIRVVDLTPEEKRRYEERLAPIYSSGWISAPETDLIRRIRLAGEHNSLSEKTEPR